MKTFKKVMLLTLTSLMALSLTACQAFIPALIANNAASKAASSMSEKTEFLIGDTVTLNDWDITVHSIEFVDSIPNGELLQFTPGEGNKYALLHMTIKNVGTAVNTFSPTISFGKNGVMLIYDGQYEYAASRLLGHSDDLHDKSCNPLVEASGFIAFSVVNEVAKTDKPLVARIADSNNTYTVKLR